MTHAKRVLLYLVVVLGPLTLAGALPAGASAQVLPAHLKNVHCSRLAQIHNETAYCKHLLRDLCGRDTALYQRMYATVVGESGWGAHAHNASGATGYAQFMPEWWNGHGSTGWSWNPYNGALNIRVFYYVVTHGGWSNWWPH